MKKVIFILTSTMLLATGCGAKTSLPAQNLTNQNTQTAQTQQLAAGNINQKTKSMDTVKMEAQLKQAIDEDSTQAVQAVLLAGATANDRWELNTTPVEYAVATYKKKALAELLKAGGDPNLRDDEGDSAVTLAVQTFAKDPEILSMVLKAGGDPNTKRPDDDPVIVRFINDRNCDGVKVMKNAGADINARNRSHDPLVIYAGIIEYWDIAWCLLELGAKYDYPDERISWPQIFNRPYITTPDSPQYPNKVKVWEFLTKNGIQLPPLQ